MMKIIHSKEEIAEAIILQSEEFIHFIDALDKKDFEDSPNGKWSAGQNLDHLIRSTKPLQLAFRLPGFVLTRLFGRSNRPTRSFDQVVEKYKKKLAEGGRASGRFIPAVVDYDRKEVLIKEFRKQAARLSNNVLGKEEIFFDLYILPHPLLGKLTVREMMFFTIHHYEHHRELLNKRFG